MPNARDHIRSYILDPFPKCLFKEDCFEEGNPDLEGLCEPCYREKYMAQVQVEAISLQRQLEEKQRYLLGHQTKIAMKRNRLRHRCLICQESGQRFSSANDLDVVGHVLEMHFHESKEEGEKPARKRSSKPKTPKKEIVEEYI